MSIVYVHGVKVRSAAHGEELGKSFTRLLGSKLSVDNAPPSYESVYWGDLAATFLWNLQSRPRTVLLGQGGAEDFAGLGSMRGASDDTIFDRVKAAPLIDGPVLGAPPRPAQQPARPLATILAEKRPDFLADLYLACLPTKGEDPIVDQPAVAGLAAAAEAVAERWDEILASEATEDARARKLVAAVESVIRGSDLIDMGGPADWMGRAGEVVRRAVSWPGDAIGTVLGEARPVMHEFVAYFIGDVFTYLSHRGDHAAPGAIPSRILAALRRAQQRKKATGEKIVIVSHSMGGQLVYDALSYFAEGDDVLGDIEVDHWISCGSQVSFFAELRLFLGQADVAAGAKLKMPERVKGWTNFYDPNDLVGFVMEPVFDGVKDLQYNTGSVFSLPIPGS